MVDVDVRNAIIKWLKYMLRDKAPGLLLSDNKTKVAEFGGSHRPFIRQSRRMDQIQSSVSGGFDAIAGAEILDAVQGLIRSQEALSHEEVDNGWKFTPLPDVRDETVARFSAGRFRTTYRSIRPLLEEGYAVEDTGETSDRDDNFDEIASRMRTQRDIDDEAQSFSLSLIGKWIVDPSNVRLLRVGFDIYPDATVLKAVLDLLRPFTQSGSKHRPPRYVAWYCLGELLRAGATETGFVDDDECLPKNICLEKYQQVLCDEAVRLVQLPGKNIPWYLRQQALLFLATFNSAGAPIVRRGRSKETAQYHKLILFLRGQQPHLTSSEFATLAILSHRGFPRTRTSARLDTSILTTAQKTKIAIKDPLFARELGENNVRFFDGLPTRIRRDLCVDAESKMQEGESLVNVVLGGDPMYPLLRNELSLLLFSIKLLDELQKPKIAEIECISPWQIRFKIECNYNIGKVDKLNVLPVPTSAAGSLYTVPHWCKPTDRWRFQLGFLLRFILSQQVDFSAIVLPENSRRYSKAYQPVKSHWYQRLYGLFNAQQAFGDNWAPITDWMEQFLLALLCWPGCQIPSEFDWVRQGIEEARLKIQNRIDCLEKKRGPATRALMLPMVIGPPTEDTSPRPLRACVVQTVVPDTFDNADLTCSDRSIRRRHRNHLSTALQAVYRMLSLRGTHEQGGGRLDWLILPELAVHPSDVQTHLVPFARANKTLILTGLTYQELFLGRPAINSALWIMPEWTRNHGLQIRTRRQGKCHLAPDETQRNVQGFRPCQWLIGYPWSEDQHRLWLSASICYDATDLGLTADLRNQSDVFSIPAFNKDVKTFDQMALALHYHMYQLVVLVNNGKYGGSNAYWPSADPHRRQIFHMHGQPQASIAFLDIDITEMEDFLGQRQRSSKHNSSNWKYPPAGLD